MSKIGFYQLCATASNGAATSCHENGAPEIVTDADRFIKVLSTDENNIGKTFYVLKQHKEGILVGAVTPTNKAGYYDSIWLYFFNNVDYSADINNIAAVLAQNNIAQIKEEIHPYLTKEYNFKTNVSSFLLKPNTCGHFAVRYYAQGTPFSLEQILAKPFQKDYADYEAILLIDKATGLKAESDVIDLSDVELAEYCTIRPPKSEIIFKPYIQGERFTESDSFLKGTTINIEWRADNYENIHEQVQISQDESIIQFDVNKHQSRIKRTLKRSEFKFKDKNGNTLNQDFIIEINGETLTDEKVLSYEQLQNLHIKIYEQVAVLSPKWLTNNNIELIQIRQGVIPVPRPESEHESTPNHVPQKKYTKKGDKFFYAILAVFGVAVVAAIVCLLMHLFSPKNEYPADPTPAPTEQANERPLENNTPAKTPAEKTELPVEKSHEEEVPAEEVTPEPIIDQQIKGPKEQPQGDNNDKMPSI